MTQLDRLISETEGQDDDTSYSYDLNHNRLQKSGDDTTEAYRYQEAANRLLQRNETGQSLPTPREDVRYEYNNAGRIWRYHEADRRVAEYIYNAGGQRTRKILYDEEGTVTQTIIYHWSIGMLVEETTATGELIRNYIPGTGNMPVAQVDVHKTTEGDTTEQVSYLYADHLDTPRLATNGSQAVVWRWDSDAFGDGDPVTAAIAGQQDTVINLRFPGQYYDKESGLYYNWNRYYNPQSGRYIRSDPVGLNGGINTYSYAWQNAIRYTDVTGLFTYNHPPPRTEPLRGDALELANCIEKCIGEPFVVTGGRECEEDGRHTPDGVKGSKHCTDQAFDMRKFDIDRNKLLCCARECGAKYIMEYTDRPIWHFQTVKGKGEAIGELKDLECTCDS